MTLAARLRIVPSRRLAALGACVAAGAVALPVVTLAAWIDSEIVAAFALAAVLGGALLGWRVYRRALSASGFEILISGQGDVQIVPDLGVAGCEDLHPDGGYRLASGSVAWPGFSVLAMSPTDPTTVALSESGRLRIAVLRSDLAAEDARALHRFMLWSLRGGAGTGHAGGPAGG